MSLLRDSDIWGGPPRVTPKPTPADLAADQTDALNNISVEIKGLREAVEMLTDVILQGQQRAREPVERRWFDFYGSTGGEEQYSMPLHLSMIEDFIMVGAMERAAGNKAKAADLLGINRTTLVEKMRRKGLEDWAARGE